MMRSLWTGATGMISQQTNVDTIANNLSNVNTAGYKTEKVEFKSLLYQNIQKKSTSTDGTPKPVGAQVGLGTRPASITTNFAQGIMRSTGSYSDWAIEGNGFFKIQTDNSETQYTRNGSFQMSLVANGTMVTNTDGCPVLDVNDDPIIIPKDYNVSTIALGQDGKVFAKDAKGNMVDLGIQVGIVQFANPAGLEKNAGSLYSVTDASGEPMEETANPGLKRSTFRQQYLEGSNVQTVDEMVNLIVAQRAYEMNSKVIQASDTMLQQANQLRG